MTKSRPSLTSFWNAIKYIICLKFASNSSNISYSTHVRRLRYNGLMRLSKYEFTIL